MCGYDPCEGKSCQKNEQCTRKGESLTQHECVCSVGSTRNKKSNKCEEVSQCAILRCSSKNAVCAKLKTGEYKCECKAGFSDQSGNCTNINECDKNNTICGTDPTWCEDTEGSYMCNCPKGYSNAGASLRGTCEDQNECANNLFCVGGNCTNTAGSANCTCASGFIWKSELCQDIDECQKGTHKCQKDTNCENTNGGYDCQCRSEGYKKINQTHCEDIDECRIQSPDVCGDATNVGKCQNTPGGWRCECLLYGEKRDDLSERAPCKILQPSLGMWSDWADCPHSDQTCGKPLNQDRTRDCDVCWLHKHVETKQHKPCEIKPCPPKWCAWDESASKYMQTDLLSWAPGQLVQERKVKNASQTCNTAANTKIGQHGISVKMCTPQWQTAFNTFDQNTVLPTEWQAQPSGCDDLLLDLATMKAVQQQAAAMSCSLPGSCVRRLSTTAANTLLTEVEQLEKKSNDCSVSKHSSAVSVFAQKHILDLATKNKNDELGTKLRVLTLCAQASQTCYGRLSVSQQEEVVAGILGTVLRAYAVLSTLSGINTMATEVDKLTTMLNDKVENLKSVGFARFKKWIVKDTSTEYETKQCSGQTCQFSSVSFTFNPGLDNVPIGFLKLATNPLPRKKNS